MHSSLTVADYLLKKSEDSQITLTPLQLIKLVYLCHGWMLGLHGRPLLVDNVEVWRYGPVLAPLYHVVRKFRGNPVTGPLVEDTGKFNDHEKSIMDQVFDIYSQYTGGQLSSMTHAPGTPWSQTSKDGWAIIPNNLIQEHFSELAQQSNNAA